MGNCLRTCYLVVPFVLTLLALVLLIITLLNLSSGTSDPFLESLYFLRLNTSSIQLNNQDLKIPGLAGYYDIGLFQYCKGEAGQNADFCSTRQFGYYFDPLEAFNASNIIDLNDTEWNDALSTYKSVSKFVSIAYIIAVIALGLSFLLGLLTFCLSRFTNFLTTLTGLVGALFTIAGSASATALFIVLKGQIAARLNEYKITTDLGGRVLAITWLASAAALIAVFFWSCGCCCGHDRSKRDLKRVNSLGARNAYARVPSPMGNAAHTAYGGYTQPAVPLQPQYPLHPAGYQQSPGYEPYRGQVV